MILSLLLAVDLCAGRVQDKGSHDLVLLAKPLPGATYFDPSFGTYITRITNAQPSEGPNAVIIPMYGTMPAWSADESKLLLWHREKGWELYQGDAPYAFIRNVPFFHPTDVEQVLWDPIDPNVVWYPTNYNANPWLVRHDVSTDTATIAHDFSKPPTNCPVGDSGKFLTLGSDPQYMGRGPDKLLGLRCGPNVFVYSIAQDKVIWGPAPATESNLAPIVSPDEKWSVYLSYVIDTTGKPVRQLADQDVEIAHASIGPGRWNSVAFDGQHPGAVVSWDLATGERKVVVGPDTGWPYPGASTHLSALGPAGWVAVSTVADHSGKGPLNNELYLANVETGAVYRVGHNRSWAGTMSDWVWAYWSEPHVVISPTGTRLLFASDWEGSSTVDTYVVDLRKPKMKLNCSAACVVNSLVPTYDLTCDPASCQQVK